MASPSTAQSDRELRAELKRLGFNAGPVTDTTRQVYLKKLMKLKAEVNVKSKAPKPPNPGRKLLGFSSDESDGESASNRRRSMPAQGKSLRRRSTKVQPQTAYNGTAEEYGDASPRRPTLPNSSAKSKRYSTGMMMPSVRPTFGRLELKNENRDVSMRGRPSPSRGVISHSAITPKSTTKGNEFSDSDVEGSDEEEEEDMEVELNENEPKTKASSTNTTNPFNQTYTKYDEANDSTTAKKSSGYWWSTTKPSPRRSLPASTPRTSTPRKSSSNRLRLSDAYNDEVDASKLSTTQNNSNFLAPHPQNDVNSRFPNSVAGSNKYPQTSSSSFLNSKSNHTPLLHKDQSGAQPVNSKPNKSYRAPSAAKNEDLFEEFATEDRSASSLGAKIGHHIPMILLSCAFLFFVILAMVYMNVGSGNLEDLKFIDGPGKDTVQSEETRHKEAMRIVQALYDKLSDIAGKYECGSQDVTSKNMSAEVAKVFLKHEFKADMTANQNWIEYHFKNALHKIINNPQWGLRLYNDKNELLPNSDEEDMSPLDLEDQTVWLESIHPQMSLLCRIRRSALLVFFRLFLLCLGVLALWLIYKYVMYLLRRDREQKNQVHQLVDSITEMLASHHKACSTDKNLSPYLAIPHVRDTLIPLKHRKEKQHLWDRAVHFIDTNESRVRVETQQVSGEEFLVWRWMLPSPVVSSFTPMTELELNPNRVKVWQGTAFDNLDTAIKMPRYSPTPCLKIRNMFDPTLESDGDWHIAIEDAVLERCGDNGGIVHIAVDKSSREGCVYVKCSTPQCAGQAYKALQGSWFDGKLVTVKYLRLERYHQRFLAATNCNTPIWPSNNLKSSLSHQYQSSSLEAS